VAGSLLQLVVQVPAVVRVAPDVRFALDVGSQHVRLVWQNLLPVVVSRGVIQVSAYVDQIIASFLPTGAVTGLLNAQNIYMLPISLFGMSVAAVELPSMAAVAGSGDEGSDRVRQRLDSSRRRWRARRSAT
jgi:putative peptidoglycan lipid II flippase